MSIKYWPPSLLQSTRGQKEVKLRSKYIFYDLRVYTACWVSFSTFLGMGIPNLRSKQEFDLIGGHWPQFRPPMRSKLCNVVYRACWVSIYRFSGMRIHVLQSFYWFELIGGHCPPLWPQFRPPMRSNLWNVVYRACWVSIYRFSGMRIHVL
jgi:hypothetical protein